MKSLLDGLKALGPARLAAMGIVAAGLFGLLALLALRGGAEPYALLYADLDLRESGQIADQLTRQHIPFQLSGQGSQIMVPSDQVARTRLMLAKDGLPSGGSVGYEIFDRGDSMAASQFQQAMSRTRAMEGELARTIKLIQGVRAARVHLVLPHREPFSRDQQDAQASVMLTMTGAARLDREGVQAVLNLVAAAVPGLKPHAITIVDNRGNMLARAGEAVGFNAQATTAEEIRHAAEARLSRAVEEMLERTVGPGRVRAEAAVEMDFDRINETQEKFDPDGQVVRSTQNVTDNNKSTEANSNVSVQNNLPNADAANSGTGSQEARQEETTNYEIGKTVRTVIREQPQIRRISLAVMVDGIVEAGADGKPVWKPRPDDDIQHMISLVRGAIGFDEKRGDRVDIVSMRLVGPDDAASAEPSGLFGLPLERTDLLRLAQTGFLALVAILALLFILRPMVVRLTPPAGGLLTADGGMMMSSDMAMGALAHAGAGMDQLNGQIGGQIAGATNYSSGLAGAPAGSPAAIAAAGGPQAMMLEDESMVNIAHIDGQMRASSLRRIGDLVARYPEETLSIIRGWMTAEPE